eukprot:Blabericola_migrator_1__13530@NODE_98_length_14373_cov_122_493220_g88_i0_p4_GENE_NODE_98_length_14373_cov_122_493220_g88_i0NODE_98_length_14373_cov_122_493220_g88_i0_p4_ORF_typecomplete_len306_score81_51DUF2353/PF09789_9/6_3e02DUF2353/PF09789_9/6_7e05CCCAP/PF15964_5/5_6CCCAP/PF15964_5/0_00052CALCOCO1/PF07888_11/1_7e03CALCOCO1/PF07888_11/0_0014Shugoshin_N/PF07558_11/1_2Shugoshin_N/PF07558_11/0_054Shugoshin_N/PF07558_11/6_4e03Shugoshin_N/PF07558_11/1_8e02MAD/PF05557_13/0_0081KASH_CCD/PF14662_6/0_1
MDMCENQDVPSSGVTTEAEETPSETLKQWVQQEIKKAVEVVRECVREECDKETAESQLEEQAALLRAVMEVETRALKQELELTSRFMEKERRDNAVRMSELEAENIQLRKKVAALKESSGFWQAMSENLDQESKEFAKANAELDKQNAQLAERIAALEMELTSLAAGKQIWKAAHEAEVAKTRQMQMNIKLMEDELKSQHMRGEEIVDRLQAICTECETRLVERDQVKEKYKCEIKKLHSVIEQEEMTLATKENQLRDIENDNRVLINQIKRLENEIGLLNIALKRKKEEVVALREELFKYRVVG